MSEQPADPDELDQHDQPAKQHGDKLEEVVTDPAREGARSAAEMHDEQ